MAGLARLAYRHLRLAPEHLRSLTEPTWERLVSQAPSSAQCDHPGYQAWVARLGLRHSHHRKTWEWCTVLEALARAGLLRPGVSALGFGVGREQIPAILAGHGVRVVATDQPVATAGQWVDSAEHAEGLEAIRHPQHCPDAEFARLVSFRVVDMRAIPPDLTGFDAVWSSCCFEHLGSAQAGLDFVLASLGCLRPGGLAVHTTEMHVGGRRDTVDLGHTVLYSRADLEALVLRLRRLGHRVRVNFRVSRRSDVDRHVDRPPYDPDRHLRVEVDGAVTTSFALVVRARR